MSLAAKSQLLFGIAALLLIGAALAVQFQQIEQLTAQLNFAAGRAVAQREIDTHVNQRDSSISIASTQPTTRPTLRSYLRPPEFSPARASIRGGPSVSRFGTARN